MAKDIEDSEITGNEVEFFEGLSIINIQEIAYVCQNDKSCSVYMKSGDYLEVNLEIDEIGLMIDCKKILSNT